MLILNIIGEELKVMIEIIILHILKNIGHIFLPVLPIKLLVLMIALAKKLCFTEEKMQFLDLLENVLKNMNIDNK